MVKQRGWSPGKIPKIIENQTSAEKHDGSHLEIHKTKKPHMKSYLWETELTWPRVFTQLQHRVPPVPTTNQPVTTDYSGCCLYGFSLRTKRIAVENTGRNTPACCLGCCQSDDSRRCSEKRAIEPKTAIQIITIAMSSRTVWQRVQPS